jgi:hypothetical protein
MIYKDFDKTIFDSHLKATFTLHNKNLCISSHKAKRFLIISFLLCYRTMVLGMSLALQVTVALVAVVSYLVYRFFTSTFDYWQKKGVVFVPPTFLMGSMKPVLLIQEHLGEYFERLYKEYSNERFVGYFMGKKPTLLVRDPELVKHIMIKDFAYFTDHGFDVRLFSYLYKRFYKKLLFRFMKTRIRCRRKICSTSKDKSGRI